jgi:KUP system potassium uptake protein
VTGGEALYADLGHFGKQPIRWGWYGLVMPALVLNYFGQGALLLAEPEAIKNPFYLLAPDWAEIPLFALATLAATVASQALISASFSVAKQAMQLGILPRMRIWHTSVKETGQIYVPAFNWTVMTGTLGLVLAFRSSERLAAAFGLAVSGTMAITTVLFAFVARRRLGWSVAALAPFFLSVDLGFVAANVAKVGHGGWVPLLIGGGLFVLMTVWSRGRAMLRQKYHERAFPLDAFLASFSADPCARVPGTAVFLSPNVGATPPALLHYLKHAKSLHENVVILTVQTEEVPHVTPDERVAVEALAQGFWRVVGRYGFMETPDVPALFRLARERGMEEPRDVTYFLGRETVVASHAKGSWGQRLFALMHRNARPAADFFGLPPNRVMEVGAQVEL